MRKPPLWAGCVFLFAVLTILPGLSLSQNRRAVIDGTIHLDGTTLPPTTLIRILHADSSIAKTISPYDPFKGKFGARLSTLDGFDDDERILFRIVLSSQDSFIARSTSSILFKGLGSPQQAPNIKADVFRNHVPQLRRQVPDTVIYENQIFRYRLVAIDLDGDTISYAIRKAPPGSKIDGVNGLFSWKPDYEQSGTHEIGFSVSDGFDTDTSKVTRLTVIDVNRPAYFTASFPDTVVREAQTLRYQLRGEDPDREPVGFSARGLPAGALFDSLTGQFEWTPAYDQAGQYDLITTIFDRNKSGVSHKSRITVVNVNRPPVFTEIVSDTTIDENQEVRIHYAGSDPDHDSIKFSLATAFPDASVTPEGVFTWRPSFRQAGDYSVTVAISDDSLKSLATTKIHVKNVNRVPTLPALLRPMETDTVQLISAKPIVFTWVRAKDEDSDDTLRYLVRIRGQSFDTTIAGLRDSILSLNLRPRLEAASNYTWTLSVSDGWVTLTAPESKTFRTSAATSSKELTGTVPRVFSLEHNYPNPFNPTTSIRYAVPERSYIKLTVWNMLGELVQELVSGEKDAGVYESTFRAESLPSGVYLMKLEAHPISGGERKDFISTKKMILVK